jgi:hypothetical protein
MWRGVLLSTLCLIACHRPPAPPPEAPAPTAAAPRPPPVAAEPRAGGPDEVKGEAEARCTRDEDCALTQLATEGCCP